jgi:hypothetical protein
MSASEYGDRYWQIEAPYRTFWIHADTVDITAEGALVCYGHGRAHERQGDPMLLMAFAPGKWLTVAAASVMDGHQIAVEHRSTGSSSYGADTALDDKEDRF